MMISGINAKISMKCAPFGRWSVNVRRIQVSSNQLSISSASFFRLDNLTS